MKYFRIPTLPMVLGVVLGFMVESNYRRALVLSDGDHMTFVEDPISATLLVLAAIFIIISLVRHVRDSVLDADGADLVVELEACASRVGYGLSLQGLKAIVVS
jgi:putative tricarboxylic transport membrane protein